MPAVLALEALNSPYTLSKHEDDIVVNPTLVYYLKTEYGIDLPGFDSDKDSLNDFLSSLEETADQRGWKIIREVSLGLLSFLKISMYNDLLRNEDRIKKNPVIRAMAGDSSAANDIPEALSSFDLDSIRPQDCYQVMSADSSQQDAILYSKKDISFVMQGPPGTGKSQTITNIIAEALADGKKVLFVSEKMAALQVVYRRLQEAHLADFCLPLHSYKANKKEILEQIGANLKLKQTRVKDTALADLDKLLELRNELRDYAVELHRINPELNMSCYEVYSKLEEIFNAPNIPFALDNILSISQSDLQLFLSKLKEYSFSLNRLHNFIKDNPWDGLSSRMPGYEYTERMQQELSLLNSNLSSLIKTVCSVPCCIDNLDTLRYKDISEFATLLHTASELPVIPNIWLKQFDFEQAISEAQNGKQLYGRLFDLESDIKSIFNSQINGFDCNAWKKELLTLSSNLVEMNFVDDSTPNFYAKSHRTLSEVLTALSNNLMAVNKAFCAINAMLGTSYTHNLSNIKSISELLDLIRGNDILPSIWFASDMKVTKQLVSDAKIKSIETLKCKEKILGEWEQEALTLDYSPILSRFKTDYTSIFKVFNSQYKKDRKQIQMLSKNVIKKLSDSMAVDLLNDLKTYQNCMEWFENEHDRLTGCLSAYYTGIDTKWDDVLSAISVFEGVEQLSIDKPSSQLIEMLSADHKEQVELLDSLSAEVMTSFELAKSIITENRLLYNSDTADFDPVCTVDSIKTALSILERISGQIGQIQPYLNNTEEKIETIYESIEELNRIKETKNQISVLSPNFVKLFDFMYKEHATNWDIISALLSKIKDIKKSPLFEAICPTINQPSDEKKKTEVLSMQLSDTYSAGIESFKWINNQFSCDTPLDEFSLTYLDNKIKGCLENIDILEGWIDYQESKESCEKIGLSSFISRIEETEEFENIDKSFLRGFYNMWLGAVCDRSVSVRRFRRNTQDERIKNFVELDERQLLISQMRIREKLIEGLPSSNHLLKATDEVAILNKELSKKSRIMPLRKLFKMIPNLLMKLKPCLMMSPLSVSYFLETEAYHFDLVVFDEASQIFPEDAIGAIFRGAQVIVAGDSKQLPPTNFFAATTNNFDGDYDITDDDDYSDVISDSILEESASVLPNRTLLWHYRSKNESLIAFSNREIYKNNLITFPNSSNNIPNMGVEYIYVENGCYEGGGKNCNIKEAQKCVMLVLEHIQKHPERSLGIIAFSEKQQTAIENAIIDFRERMPKYENFFDDTKDEPFFVKNLENVQGDERDTIIFSICYAKDQNGKMYMRFGPLGHDGGERRLNVAITRAKCNVKLVGSILPSDIDLTRTNSEGVRMLRSYIEFARKGTSALSPVKNKEAFEAEDEFCNSVANFIVSNGYKIQRQVGCSDYKIDIAIVNPDIDGEFIAGIECDGLSYTYAKTTRDRDHLRKSVLENMGWNLYRVWSTEWCRNPKAEQEALLSFIKSLYGKNGNAIHTIKQSNQHESGNELKAIASETVKKNEELSSLNPYGFQYYKEAHYWDTKHSGTYDNVTRISENILYIVSVEQPMHMELLYKRMGPSFTTRKATEGVRSTIDEAISKKLKKQVVIDKEQFIRSLPLSPAIVRIPKQYETPRPMEYISTEEVAMAMIQIINNSFGISEDDLSSECARVFGFERKGPKIKAKTDAAIKYLVDKKKMRVIDGKAQLMGE